MPMKFKQDIWTKVKDHIKDTAEGAVLAFEDKRDDIEKNVLPEFATKQLTQEQIRRSGRIGIVVGAIALFLFLLAVAIVLWQGIFL